LSASARLSPAQARSCCLSVDFLVKINRTGAEHQHDFDELRPLGYRPNSLSVHNGTADPRYSVVWVRRAGPDWSAVHGLDGAGYQAAFDAAVAAGFQPMILSATGWGGQQLFAGVFEQRPGGTPLTRFGLVSGAEDDPATIQHWNREAHRNGWLMTCGAVYGDPGSPRFAGIWPRNLDNVAWNADGIAETADDYQARYDAQVAGFARPAFVTLSDYGAYLSIFRDDVVGPVVARHNLTFDGLNYELSRLDPLGFFPICLQAGAGGDPRFAVLFALRDRPLAREWRVTGGPIVGMKAVDDAVRAGLQASTIRGASVAVVRGTRLVAARGYTFAEPGYPTVLPQTPFRIASVSKTVTALAVEQLIEQNLLGLDSRLGDVLPLTTPAGGTPDPGFANVTVRELLEHRSGLTHGVSDAQVRQAFAGGLTLPVSAAALARYVSGLPLEDATKPVSYNNLGYWLLGQVVAARRGTPTFYDAIRASLLDPLGITRLRLSMPQVWANDRDEARYHRLGQTLDAGGQFREGLIIGRSVMQNDQPLVPFLYGDRNLLNEDASGGLSAAATDLARLVAAVNRPTGSAVLSRASVLAMLQRAADHFAAIPAGQEARAGYGFDDMNAGGGGFRGSKGGYLFTSQNMLWFELDRTSLVICLNGTSNVDVMGPVWTAVQGIDWSHRRDRFPRYGMASL